MGHIPTYSNPFSLAVLPSRAGLAWSPLLDRLLRHAEGYVWPILSPGPAQLERENRIISIARKPVVGKFELRVSRPLPHVYRLSRHAQFVSSYVNYIGKYICQAAHVRRLVRTYLVRIFPRRGLSTWCKTNLFLIPERYSRQKKCTQSHVKNWPKDQRVSISF